MSRGRVRHAYWLPGQIRSKLAVRAYNLGNYLSKQESGGRTLRKFRAITVGFGEDYFYRAAGQFETEPVREIPMEEEINFTAVTIPERIAAFLKSHWSDAYCDDCLASALGLRRPQVSTVTATLGLCCEYSRGAKSCSICGKAGRLATNFKRDEKSDSGAAV